MPATHMIGWFLIGMLMFPMLVALHRYRKEHTVGMFDKDKEIGRRIDHEFELGAEFIVWDAKIDTEEVSTSIGNARKTRLLVSTLRDPRTMFEAATLGSAIADKVAEATPLDFPAVVKLLKVPSSKSQNDALVIQFVREYGDDESRAGWQDRLQSGEVGVGR